MEPTRIHQLYERAINATEDDVYYKRELHAKLADIRANLEKTVDIQELPYTRKLIELVPGWNYRTIVYEKGNLDILSITAEKESNFPAHSHSQKQIVHVINGVITYELTGHSVTLSPGDTLVIPPNTIHSSIPESDCQLITVFIPPISSHLTLPTPPINKLP